MRSCSLPAPVPSLLGRHCIHQPSKANPPRPWLKISQLDLPTSTNLGDDLNWLYLKFIPSDKLGTGANSDPVEFENCSEWQEFKTCVLERCRSQDSKALNVLVFAGGPAFFHFGPLELWFSGPFIFGKKNKNPTFSQETPYLKWS